MINRKVNRLEIWRLNHDGMECLHTKVLYGTISMLQRLQPKDSPTDLLFIGTDRFQYFNVTWNAVTSQLETVEQTIDDTAEHFMRHSQSQNKCMVDPTGKFMAMMLWEGVLNVLRLPTRKGSTMKLELLDQVRLSELWIKSSCFIHSPTGHPKIAFLYKTQLGREEAHLAVYRLTKDDKGGDVSQFDPNRGDREFTSIISDPYASMLIPIPMLEEKRYHVRNQERTEAHLGGLLVVGETLLTYFDSLTYSAVSSALTEPKIYVAWVEIDGTHFLLADDYGRLDLLTIDTVAGSSGVLVDKLSVRPMEFPDSSITTSRASNLVYIGHDVLFLGSHHGDSQFLNIDISTQTMILTQTMSNNAPILDFAIMDLGGNRDGDALAISAFSSGQTRLVAGCGAYGDGSLRSIRSGVGLDDRAVLDEIHDTKGLFSLISPQSAKTDILVISLIDETRILKFHPEGAVEELDDFAGLSLDSNTLLASSPTGSGQFLQVTPKSAVLLDAESGVRVSEWNAPEGQTITAASANAKWTLLSLNGATLVVLDLRNGLTARLQQPRGEKQEEHDQISCLHASRDLQDVGIIGWWSSGRISIINLDNLEAYHSEPLRQSKNSASVPRDVVLVQLYSPSISGPTLLAALEDGTVVTFNVEPDSLAMSGRKSVTLGNSPARLHILPQPNGTCNVFTTTEHASLIYSTEGRIMYSATTADDATFVVPFDSEAYPDSIILSTDNQLKLSQVDKERLTHVKSLAVRETVRRVAYSPNLKAFGLGCIKKELVHNDEMITSSFKLVDEIVLQEVGRAFPLDGSATLELVECVIRAELIDSYGNPEERFLVGTSFVGAEENGTTEETSGRLLVLGVTEDRHVYQIVSHKLKGACRCLGILGDHIVAGLAKTVAVYKYHEKTSTTGSLEKLAAYRPSAFPIDLDIRGSLIGVVDLMQSLTLLEFIPPQDGSPARLEQKARHYEPGWATCVSHYHGEQWVECDAQGNVLILSRNAKAPTEQDRGRLEVTSEFNIGEQINRIRKLNVSSPESAIVTPRVFLASVSKACASASLLTLTNMIQIEGSIYMLGEISSTYQDLLMTVQSRLKNYVFTPGNIDFDSWRAFRNQVRESDEPYRFVDGEMIERFLDLDDEKQRVICEGLVPNVEVMRNMVEELRRLH